MTILADKDLFRPDEVAAYFQVSRRTIYNWLDDENCLLQGVWITKKIVRITRESIIKLKTVKMSENV